MKSSVKTDSGKRPWRERFFAEARPRTEAQRRHLFVLAAVLAVVGLAGFLLLLFDVTNHTGLSVVDRPVQRTIEHFRSPGLTGFMIFLAIIFGPIAMPIVVAITVVLWFLIGKHGWRPLLLAAAMITGVVLAETIAHLVGRPRPPLGQMLFGPDHTASFPSGHVLGVANYMLTGGYLVVSRIGNRKVSILIYAIAVVFLLTMAFNRVYLGYHWPTDTLAAVSLALLELGVVIAIDTWRTVETPQHRSTAETRGAESEPSAGATTGSATNPAS
ncbi:phosphatase PAP2 family protein [Amnibacterium sp. CER49]|uniref:phosphatase PAP2 family protein n=1 Tax=Amnibacterium sp. CER49 TaxID=3039161 RepID=UPI00244A2199|nr:phosphatase PAP2 family protein [Amnibacterium sp. CER49]MDH2443755.1 phosphatase PAP2 family protein [Amnibacterium sp. CER49]